MAEAIPLAATAAVSGSAAAGVGIGTTAATVGTAAGIGAGAGIGATAASAGLGLGDFSIALAGLSAASSVFGGFAQSAALRARGAWSDYSAENERLKGIYQAIRVREAALRDVAAARARSGAAGLDLSSPAVGQLEDSIREVADREISVVSYNARSGAEQARGAGATFRSESGATLAGGVANAFRPLAGLMLSRATLNG